MRGEHKISNSLINNSQGSSPHARGTRMDLRTPVAVTGIIPACAGNTIAKAKRGDLVGDHPRMRGEHTYQCPYI